MITSKSETPIVMQDRCDQDTTETTALPARVRRRFADRLESVERLFRDNEEFREICRDYHDCAAQLDTLQARHAESDARVVEYRTLAAELEGEILAQLALVRA